MRGSNPRHAGTGSLPALLGRYLCQIFMEEKSIPSLAFCAAQIPPGKATKIRRVAVRETGWLFIRVYNCSCFWYCRWLWWFGEQWNSGVIRFNICLLGGKLDLRHFFFRNIISETYLHLDIEKQKRRFIYIRVFQLLNMLFIKFSFIRYTVFFFNNKVCVSLLYENEFTS